MPVFLRIRLTELEKKELKELEKDSKNPRRTKQRIEILRLSEEGYSVAEIAKYKKVNETTVRQTIKRWLEQGKEGLFDQPRPGRKRKWKEEDISYIEECLKEERTYNSEQLRLKLKEERQVELSGDRIRKILKKKDWKWKRTKTSLKGKQNQKERERKEVDILTLKAYKEEGLVKIKYLDEAGFSLDSPVSYTYVKKGEQKEINQPKSRGKRLSILGVFQEDENFEYALKVGSFKSEDYIEFMNWQAEKAQENYLKTGAITVIIQDNYSVHKSKEVKKYLEQWKKQGLELFFLSAYSPELNLIETEWHQLKTHELAGRMFEDTYDLAIAVKKGIANRSQKHNLNCEMFIFN